MTNKMTLKNCIRNHYLVAFFTCLAISICLIIGGFFAPPQGEIDGSVLKAVGELFLFPTLAAGVKALDDNKKIKLQHGATTIVVGERKPGDEMMPPPPHFHEGYEPELSHDIEEGETEDA